MSSSQKQGSTRLINLIIEIKIKNKIKEIIISHQSNG